MNNEKEKVQEKELREIHGDCFTGNVLIIDTVPQPEKPLILGQIKLGE